MPPAIVPLLAALLFASPLVASPAVASPRPASSPIHAVPASADFVTECYSQDGRTGCVQGPASARKGPRRPLILFLHGYGGSGEDDALGLLQVAKDQGALYAYVQGTPDERGRKTWGDIDDAAAAAPKQDDAKFIDWFVGQAEKKWSVDARRISIAGWSLGAFMALQFACDGLRRVASVAIFEGGAMVANPRCAPLGRTSVLLIHGDADRIIEYAGGTGARTGLAYAPVAQVFESWSQREGCSGLSAAQDRLDLNSKIAGPETRRDRAGKCPAGVAVELWTVEGGVHFPDWTPNAPGEIGKFLLAHAAR